MTDVSSAPAPQSGPPAETPAVQQVVITTGTIWRAVAIVLATLAALWGLNQMRSLVMMLAVSLFFALALTPGVNYLHARRGWRRGAAVGVIYVVGVVAVVVMVVLIVPAVAKVGGQISSSGTQWMTGLDTWTSSKLGFHIVGQQAYKDGVVTVGEFLKQWAGKLMPAAGKLVSTGAGLVFEAATIGLFTFYLTADFPRLQRAFLSWFKPGQQERLGWTVDQSIKQVGGYLYSRLLLTVINGLGFLAVMVAVGVPTGLAIPLAVFGGFVSEFIPSVGTYIGGAVPAVLTLALAGPVPALIVIAYIVVYQQIENYWLSPRISAKTMELNGGLAFGAAIAGGALFGPMGAFMALPVAALIVAVLHNYRHAYPVFYKSQYADAAEQAAAAEAEADGSSLSTVSASRDGEGGGQRA
jgi:predicted PurR-regulated permease PerM